MNCRREWKGIYQGEGIKFSLGICIKCSHRANSSLFSLGVKMLDCFLKQSSFWVRVQKQNTTLNLLLELEKDLVAGLRPLLIRRASVCHCVCSCPCSKYFTWIRSRGWPGRTERPDSNLSRLSENSFTWPLELCLIYSSFCLLISRLLSFMLLLLYGYCWVCPPLFIRYY